jgi:hypothetical protein
MNKVSYISNQWLCRCSFMNTALVVTQCCWQNLTHNKFLLWKFIVNLRAVVQYVSLPIMPVKCLTLNVHQKWGTQNHQPPPILALPLLTIWSKQGVGLKTGHCSNEILSTYQNTNINFSKHVYCTNVEINQITVIRFNRTKFKAAHVTLLKAPLTEIQLFIKSSFGSL